MPEGLKTYPNQYPSQLGSELEDAERLGVTLAQPGTPEFDSMIHEGRINYFLNPDGQLDFVPQGVGGEWIHHTVSSGGQDVVAAGEVDLAGSSGQFIGLDINTRSGHYRPDEECEEIARESFESSGLYSRQVKDEADGGNGMSRSPANFIDCLLRSDPSEVEAWFAEVDSGRISAPPDFNWLLLAEVAGSRATNGPRPKFPMPTLGWARIATSIYDRLSKSERNGGSFARSSMMIRAVMIRDFGPSEGNPVRDPKIVTSWFLNSLNTTREKARQKAQSWRRLPVEEIRELRSIKNKLNVLQVLQEAGLIDSGSELEAWLNMRSMLP